MTRLRTSIWSEEAESDNPFAARVARCRGYDVYGQMLGDATFTDMLLLLFLGERPHPDQRAALNSLAVAICNPGPRDPSVHAAMSAAVGGSQSAAALMAALAAGAGQGGGGRDVLKAMQLVQSCGDDLAAWRRAIEDPPVERADVWPVMDHVPGFDPHSDVIALPVLQALEKIADLKPDGATAWLQARRDDLEQITGRALSMSGVAACTYLDLGLGPTQGEMLHLILRLPGAAAHALEQGETGFKTFPFGGIDLLDDPQRTLAASGSEAS